MRAKKVIVGCLLLLLFVGCGGAITPQPTSVLITRNSPPTLHLEPLSRRITDRSKVQKLYAAAIDLPSIAGTIHCPTSSYGGLNYQLQFAAGNNVIQNMNLDAATCRLLRIGQSDVRQTNPAFITLFVQTADIPSFLPEKSTISEVKV